MQAFFLTCMHSSVSFAGFQSTRNHNITSPGKNHCNPSQMACLGSCSLWRWPSTPRCLRLPVQTSCTAPWPASGMRLYSRTEPSKVIKVPSCPQYSNISISDLVPNFSIFHLVPIRWHLFPQRPGFHLPPITSSKGCLLPLLILPLPILSPVTR